MQQDFVTASGGAGLYVCSEPANPASCLQEGLSCQSCTSDSARHVARLCRGLQDRAVRQLFVTLYPSSGCAPMVGEFVEAYRKSV